MKNKLGVASNAKIIASVVSFAVLGVLLLLGPVQAFAVNFNILHDEVNHGDPVYLYGSITIDENDQNLPVKNVTLVLGDEDVDNLYGGSMECTFDLEGNNLTDCVGIESSYVYVGADEGYGYGYGYNSFGYGYDFGYGYGYNQGKIQYKIILNSSYYSPGTYSALVRAAIGDKLFESPAKNFIIFEDEKVFADLNGDKEVNREDLEILLYQWDNCNNNCSGDLNEDGRISMLDIKLMLEHWTGSSLDFEGDTNRDGAVDLMDLFNVVNFIENGSCFNRECNADLNEDGKIDYVDVAIVYYNLLF